MELRRNVWLPDRGIPNHHGGRIQYDAYFFAAPPAEIGRVLAADSSLGRDDDPLSNAAFRRRLCMKLALVFLLFLGFTVAICITSLHPDKPFKPVYWIGYSLLQIGFCAIVFPFIIIRAVIRRRSEVFSCSCLGEDGAALCTLKGGIGDDVIEDVLVFSEASDLLLDRKHVINTLACFGVGYKYNWRNAEGESLLLSKGVYPSFDHPRALQHPFHFLEVVQQHWCNYRYERMKAEFQAEGSVGFAVGSKREIRVGLDYVEFLWPDGTRRASAEELGDMSLSHDEFRFMHSDAVWMGKDGKYSFKYSELSNAKLFITLLDHLVGVSLSDENRHSLDINTDLPIPFLGG